MSVILFIIILLALVVVHEFGHFIAAKWSNMRVDEFAFGFPPRIFSKKVGETTYAFNAIPLGGYVSILGENGEPDDKAKGNPRAFSNRPWYAQLFVLSAGVIMNVLFAWAIFIFTSYGNVEVSVDGSSYADRIKDKKVYVAYVGENSPSKMAGLETGDIIMKVSSGGATIIPTDSTSTINFIGSHINDSIKIIYKKPDGQIKDTIITGVYGIIPGKKALGIALDTIGTVDAGIKDAFILGTYKLENIFVAMIDGFKQLFISAKNGDSVVDSLSGPIGIAKMVGDTSEFGYKALLTFTAVLSINLAIFNALPLPALDGGRFIIVILETVSRRKFPVKMMTILNGVFFALLLLLLIVVSVKDVVR